MPLPCLRCGALTPSGILATFGARCSRCYGLYCRMGESASDAPPLTHDDKQAILERMRLVAQSMTIGAQDDPKAWAKALRGREKRGESLTPAQRDMWRAALGLVGRDMGETP